MGSLDSSLSRSSCSEDRVSTGMLGDTGEAAGEVGEEVDRDAGSSGVTSAPTAEAKELSPGDNGVVSHMAVSLEAFLWKL